MLCLSTQSNEKCNYSEKVSFKGKTVIADLIDYYKLRLDKNKI
jgi:hypothetical protein